MAVARIAASGSVEIAMNKLHDELRRLHEDEEDVNGRAFEIGRAIRLFEIEIAHLSAAGDQNAKLVESGRMYVADLEWTFWARIPASWRDCIEPLRSTVEERAYSTGNLPSVFLIRLGFTVGQALTGIRGRRAGHAEMQRGACHVFFEGYDSLSPAESTRRGNK